MYETVVIGRGMIGSAAARHLAEQGGDVACIGTDEPQNFEAHSGVFASHYDEGRMTRIVDPETEWSITAKHSIDRYRDLEARSGIEFFTPSGYLGLGDPDCDYNARCSITGNRFGAHLERLDAEAIRSRYPFLAVDDAATGLSETGNAGHFSPRRFVKAQTILAQQAGASIIRHAVRTVRSISSGNHRHACSFQTVYRVAHRIKLPSRKNCDIGLCCKCSFQRESTSVNFAHISDFF